MAGPSPAMTAVQIRLDREEYILYAVPVPSGEGGRLITGSGRRRGAVRERGSGRPSGSGAQVAGMTVRAAIPTSGVRRLRRMRQAGRMFPRGLTVRREAAGDG